jgi:dephospho-CoA kinase
MIIGITGSFGSGKTTVAKMFTRLGAYVIDADKVCHSLMAPSKEVYGRIVRCFGSRILRRDGHIDRKRLARVVFKKKAKLNLLNKIVHPVAIKEIERLVKINRERKIIVIDAPLLIESGFYRNVDKIIVVKNNIGNQIDRLASTNGMDKKEILERIQKQMPLKKKAAFADFIIDNSGSKKETLFQVQEIWKKL